MTELTPRQKEVLDFVMETVLQTGGSPSLRQVMSRFGFSSIRGAEIHIHALIRKGYVERDYCSPLIKVLRDTEGHPVHLAFQKLETKV